MRLLPTPADAIESRLLSCFVDRSESGEICFFFTENFWRVINKRGMNFTNKIIIKYCIPDAHVFITKTCLRPPIERRLLLRIVFYYSTPLLLIVQGVHRYYYLMRSRRLKQNGIRISVSSCGIPAVNYICKIIEEVRLQPWLMRPCEIL